jgi:cytochrome P450
MTRHLEHEKVSKGHIITEQHFLIDFTLKETALSSSNMTFSISSIALCGFILLVISRIFHKIYAKRSRSAEAAQQGCLPATKLLPKGFLGVGRLRESMEATKEERGPQYIAEIMDDVGVNTLAVPIFDYELLVTREPENVKAMMSSGDFDISATQQKSWWPLTGGGVFNAHGQNWKHSRSLVRPQLTRDQVQDVSFFEPHVKALLRKLTFHDSQGWTGKVDLSPLFYNFSIDNITEFVYGQSVHTQDSDARARLPLSWDKNGPDLVNFGHHIDECKSYIHRKGALAKYQWLMSSRKFKNHCKEVQKFVDYFVQQKLSRNDDEKAIETTTSGKPRFVLLDELAKETQDALTLRNETLHIMIAGRDNSAALLGWVFVRSFFLLPIHFPH